MECQTEQICDLSALYSLGMLDAEDVARFEGHLAAGCVSCTCQLVVDEELVGLLGFGADPASPSAALRQRLLDSASTGGASPTPQGQSALASSKNWKRHAVAGVQFQCLFMDETTRELVMLVRADPGVLYPPHRHAGLEEMFMIEGELAIGDRIYGPGEYIRSRPGSIHPSSATEGGCMFLIRTSLDDELVLDSAADPSREPVRPA